MLVLTKHKFTSEASCHGGQNIDRYRHPPKRVPRESYVFHEVPSLLLSSSTRWRFYARRSSGHFICDVNSINTMGPGTRK